MAASFDCADRDAVPKFERSRFESASRCSRCPVMGHFRPSRLILLVTRCQLCPKSDLAIGRSLTRPQSVLVSRERQGVDSGRAPRLDRGVNDETTDRRCWSCLWRSEPALEPQMQARQGGPEAASKTINLASLEASLPTIAERAKRCIKQPTQGYS